MLRTAYSAVLLIFERWELAQIHQHIMTARDAKHPDLNVGPGGDEGETNLQECMRSIIRHCNKLLEQISDYMILLGTIQTFDFLLCAYAAITLVEFAEYIDDLGSTFALMDRIHLERQSTDKVEPVFGWPRDMMHKQVVDRDGSGSWSRLRAEMLHGYEMEWTPFDLMTTAMNFTLDCSHIGLI